MTETATIPNNIRRYIAGFVVRRRRTALLRQCGVALSFALAWLLLWMLLDRVLPLPAPIRFILLACNAIAVLILLSRPIAMIFTKRFDWRVAAAQIEHRDPRFIGKLETAVSQIMLPPERRGSPPIVNQIIEQANSIAGQKLALPLVPMEPALRPWLIALATALVMSMLAFSGWLDLPQLLQRALCPLADTATVTTTRLTVATGDADVPQGGTLTITARAQRLPTGELTIHFRSDDGNSQSAQPMQPDARGDFSFVLNSIDHDWQYQITGGDAQSPLYSIRVLRPPAIAEFHIRYIYPLYMQLAPTSVTNHDGLLQAPIGTQAIVDLISTEPLQSAAILANGQRFVAHPTAQPDTYQAAVPIKQSGPYQLELRSARGVANTPDPAKANSNLTIQSIPDQPPQPRWDFVAQNLFVTADETISLPYRITDDYGAGSLTLQVDAPGQPTQQIPLPDSDELLKDRIGQATLNLSGMTSRVGQLFTAHLSAVDAIKQQGNSPPINLIIAPHSITVDDHLRIAELHIAATLGQSLEDVAGDVLRSEADSQRSSNPDPAPRNTRMSRASVLANQIADELMRAISHSHSPQLAAGLIELLDRATMIQVHAKPFVPIDDPSAAQIEHDALAHLADDAHQLRVQLETIRSGETASLAKNAMENFQSLLPIASDDGQQASVLRDALEQAGRDVDAALKAINIDPDDPELEDQLVTKIAAQDQLLHDLISSADPAARLLKQAAEGTLPKDESHTRLRAAALAEALRPDADFATAAKFLAAAHPVDSPEQRAESLAFTEAASLAANDLPTALATNQQLHTLATSKPSPGIEFFVPSLLQSAEHALANAKSVAASNDPAKIQSADQQAARLRIESLASINALLHPPDQQLAISQPTSPQASTTQPAIEPPTLSGFDEPLRIYFQAIRRAP